MGFSVARQLYDRYLHRYFDAVPVDKVQNAPGACLSFFEAAEAALMRQ